MNNVVPVDPFALAAKLGVDITNTDGRKNGRHPRPRRRPHDTEPVDLDAYPQVREELDIVTDPPTGLRTPTASSPRASTPA